jgi:serine/threonine-protein kinase HipA
MTAVDVVYEGVGGPWVVARVAQRGSEVFVEHTDDHVSRAADLAPIHHPVQDRTRRFTGQNGWHLPGLVADSMPDSWGRRVLHRDMRRHGHEQPEPLQMLTWLGRRTMWALTFQPAAGPPPDDVRLVDLDRVQHEALHMLRGAATRDTEADALARAAGSGAGGARSKITVAYTADGELIADDGRLPAGAEPWLVKFHGPDDPEDQSAVEATYLQMASDAGIEVCDHRLLRGASGSQHLAVRRFDRIAHPGGAPNRIHMATAAGLLETDGERNQQISYETLVRLVRRVTGDRRDVVEMVRRAVFNVVAHNRDDHARQFSFLWAPQDGWRLAPAYDLTHSMGWRPSWDAAGPREHYLDVAGRRTGVRRVDLHGLAKAGGIAVAEIDEMTDACLEVVATWQDWAGANGVDAEVVAAAQARLPALSD